MSFTAMNGEAMGGGEEGESESSGTESSALEKGFDGLFGTFSKIPREVLIGSKVA